MTGSTVAFILGAGASCPIIPPQRDLVLQLWQKTTKPYEPGFPINRLWPARAYLRRTFPGLKKGVAPTFEDVLGPLEISEAEEYWYHFAGRDLKGRLVTNQQVLDALDTWISYVLDPPSLPRRPGDDGFAPLFGPGKNATCVYAKLVDVLRETSLIGSTLFISMNYDILLDRCLIAAGHPPNYQVEAFLDPPAKAVGTIPVFKLHGSLNWRVCEQCHVLIDLQFDSVWPASICGTCGSQRARPMLIRPTVLKDFKHRVWKEVWKWTGRELAKAEHWVFIGYSLPLADVWMLRLLTQSVRSGGIKSRKISVVEPSGRVLERYRLLFPQAERVAKTFEQYVMKCRKAGSPL